MDVSVYHTQQAATSAKAQQPNASDKALHGGNGIFSAGAKGLSFMDLIFARATAEGQLNAGKDGKVIAETKLDLKGSNGQITTEQILQSIFDGDTSVLDGLASAEELATLNAAFDVNAHSTITDKKILADKKTLNAFIESLMIGVPQESRMALVKISAEKAQSMLDQIKDGADPSLIAAGLSPEEITKLLKDIADGNEDANAFIAASMIKITLPEVKKDVVFLPRGAVAAGQNHPAFGEQSSEELAAKLNKLTVGAEGNSDTSIANGDEDGEGDFDSILSKLEFALSKGNKNGQVGNDNGIKNAIKHITEKVSAGLSTIGGNPAAVSEVSASFDVDSIFPEGFEFSANSSQGVSLTGPAQMTSMVNHVQQAGLPHPATQMVASAIAKVTNSSESRNITIQLDPPELGRVSISMEFSKEKNIVKAIVTAEKPETHMMLQRDAQLLERALHDAGLDADGSSLEFQLSQDGNMFDQDQHSTGGHSGGGTGDANAEGGEEIEIIETTMDWYVDPNTGLTRYSALV